MRGQLGWDQVGRVRWERPGGRVQLGGFSWKGSGGRGQVGGARREALCALGQGNGLKVKRTNQDPGLNLPHWESGATSSASHSPGSPEKCLH